MASRSQVVKYLGQKEPSVLAQTLYGYFSSDVLRRTASYVSGNVVNLQRRGFLTSCFAGSTSISQDSTTPHVALMGPSVRNLLEMYHLKSVSIQPSGQKGQLLKGDVLRYIKENEKLPKMFTPQATTVTVPVSSTPKTAAITSDVGYTDFQVSNIGETVSRRVMSQSKIAMPHFYTTIECNMDKVLAMEQKLEKHNISVSVNDFIVKAVGLCLHRVPEVNSYWSEDGHPVPVDTVNVAVTVPSPNGLTTAVITTANELDIRSLSSALKELSQRAKEGQLKVEEIQGGSFTISNLGMFGVKHFTAIISPQQTGVLAVGQPQVNVSEDGQSTTVMTVTLSCDGRVVDEYTASTWLEEFQKLIENPLQMGL